jgi:hypothetical protein
MLKHAPPEYLTVLCRVLNALTNKSANSNSWCPLLIGIDGRDGSGKSSLASWLAWQIGVPSVYLDTFLDAESATLTWRIGDLRRLLDTRLQPESPRPIVVEGICLLEVLAAAGRAPDFLIFVNKEGHEGAYYLGRSVIDSYVNKWNPQKLAQYALTWAEPNVSWDREEST